MLWIHNLLHLFGVCFHWEYWIDNKLPEYQTKRYRKCKHCDMIQRERYGAMDGFYWGEEASAIPNTAVKGK